MSFSFPKMTDAERRAVSETLAALVRIESVGPAFGGPVGGEARVMAWAREFLQKLGIESELRDALPGRPNLYAKIAGKDPSRSLLFETHVDTVSTKGMTIDPLGAEIREGRMWGRGSTDAKAQVASMLHAIRSMVEGGITPAVNIELVLAVDEESGFGGVRALAREIENRDEEKEGKIIGAVIGEPTQLSVVTSHKGSQRLQIEVKGRAAHSALPQLGVNAIHHAAILVQAIEGEYAPQLARRSHPLVGSPTINVSTIEGGTQINLVPDSARIQVDRRTIPGETVQSVRAELEKVIGEVASRVPDFDAILNDPFLVDPCLETDPGDPLARRAVALSAEFGRGAEPIGVSYCTDGSKLSAIGVPTIVVGPGSIEQAHTADEWMDLEELALGAAYYRELMAADWSLG